ncbi:MAG: hypothetical protein U9R37_04495 [Campylobacterota bacterium]|nr:hypothetical protein [Campylobacterota bacterium]
MEKDETIKKVKEHIKELRKNTPELTQTDIKIALGKVIIDLKDAQKSNNTILKDIFSLK